MEQYRIQLPLYSLADYSFYATLQRTSYKIRIYFNERMQQWIVDLHYSDGEPIILGQALVPEFPLFADYAIELTGFFYLMPIGKNQNETVSNPLELSEYYQLFYYYEE